MNRISFHINKETLFAALTAAIKMFSPFVQFRTPVIFVTYLCAILSTINLLFSPSWNWFEFQIALWIWLTVFFANLAESIAESHGKEQVNTYRKAQSVDYAKLLVNEKEFQVPSHQLKKGNLILCEVGDTIPADGEVVEGVATVDESAITGESAPVIRESGGDRSAVTAGTKLVSDKLIIRITAKPGDTFLDRMIALIEGAKRQKTSNEAALNILLSFWAILYLLVVVSLKFFSNYVGTLSGYDLSSVFTLPVLIALFVCLIPTLISSLLNSVGIAGINRLLWKNVIATGEKPVEAAGDIDLLILDKTGTITIGNRVATDFLPTGDLTKEKLAEIAQLASLSDETPEGRSIVILAKENYGLRGDTLDSLSSRFIPFSPVTRLSGIDLLDEQGNVVRSIRKGAVDTIRKHIENLGGLFPDHLVSDVEEISKPGVTPLLVSDQEKIIGIIPLKDILKGGIREKLAEMRKMGIQTFMVTGDNPFAAASVAAEAGVDDFLSEVSPDKKLELIKEEQNKGKSVAMAGDGTNDAPALAQADVAIAMNSGTQASREAGNMIDLDSNPSKLIGIVEIGKQMLITRGALTIFSVASDISKYFVFIPVLLEGAFVHGKMHQTPFTFLNFMNLNSPETAILSTLIYNALIILFWIPIVLKGAYYKPQSANQLLRNNFIIYGLGGLIFPFITIKILDTLLAI